MGERNIGCDYDAALRTEVFNRRVINSGLGSMTIVPGTWHLNDCPHQIPKMYAEADAIEPMPTGRTGAMPAQVKPRFHKLKPRGGHCWTQWTNGQLFKCCESEWVPGIGTAIACEPLNLPRPTRPPSARRRARDVGRYGQRSRYDRRYGGVGAANPVAFHPGSLSMSYRPSRVGQLTGVRAGSARGAPLRRVVAVCPPGTTKRASDGACIPVPQQAAECVTMETGPASSQSCCKRGDGYWWCSDFAGNEYRPGIDAVKIPPGMTAVVNANKQVRLGHMSFTDRRNARAASTCVPACKWGWVCVAGTCKSPLKPPWGAKPAGKSKPLVIPLKDPFAVRRRRGAFSRRL